MQMEKQTDSNLSSKRCCRRRPIVSGVILLGLGLYFLAERYEAFPPVEQSWPVFIIIVGVALLIGSVVRRHDREQDTGPEVN